MKARLSDAIADYERYRTSIGMVKNTRKNDRQALTALLTHTGNIYVDNVSHDRMTEFIASRTATRTINSIVVDYRVLRTFFTWAEDTRRCPRSRNPMTGRRTPKMVKLEYPRVPVSDFPRLLHAAGQRHPRDRAFIALGLLTMARDSEICSLKVGDLDLGLRSLTMYVHKIKSTDQMGVCNELVREMRRWLAHYSQECGNLEKDWYLVPARRLVRFPGHNAGLGVTKLCPDRPVTQAPSQIVRPALKAIGWEDLKGTGVHTLRRSAAQAAYLGEQDAGYDQAVRLVQEMLHHSKPDTTEGYLGISGDRQRRNDRLVGKDLFGLPGDLQIGSSDGQDEVGRRAV